MTAPSSPAIKLVITAASEKELPESWIKGCGYPVVRTRAIISGSLSRVSRLHPDVAILFLITGVGPENSKKAAQVILQYLNPAAVVNMGTCGANTVRSDDIATGTMINPACTMSPTGRKSTCMKDPPFPLLSGLNVKRVEAVQSLAAPLLQKDGSRAAFVDMEAWFQHEIFAAQGIRFCTLKIVTDFCSGSGPSSYRRSLGQARKMLMQALSFIDNSRAKPKISVVIPVYNRAWSIRRAVDSCLSQAQCPTEIIVVDDGSRDETCEILRGYGNRINLISEEENRGVSAARNRGIRASSCEWITFLDSDDEWKKDKLRRQVDYLEKNPFLEIVQCDEIWIKNGKRINKRKYHEKGEGWLWNRSLERCMISPSCVMVKKGLLERYGLFDTTLPACEDYDLWLRLSRHHMTGLDPSRNCIKYGGHRDQLSARYPAMDRFRVYALIKALEKEDQDDFRKLLRNAILTRLTILAGGAVKRGRLDQAARYEKTAAAVKRGKALCRHHLYLLNI